MQNEEKSKRKSPYKKENAKRYEDVFKASVLPNLVAEVDKELPNRKSLKDVKMEEDKDWTNCHEIEVESERMTLFPYELKKLVYGHYRGSRGKSRLTIKSTILLILALAFLVVLIGYLIYQIGGFKIAYAFDHEARIYKQMCGEIPLQEQGENCSILRAKVLNK